VLHVSEGNLAIEYGRLAAVIPRERPAPNGARPEDPGALYEERVTWRLKRLT
jgi:hypothetical protein